MSTSLSEQLRRLTAPQTSALVDRSRRASILFDTKEAATKDRRTIYELGINGLQELVLLNTEFRQFELTLFDEATINLVRAVEHSEVNKLLDQNIKKFLQHLSPYFLLRPAHLCIEWLLRRFEIHTYNRDDLLALALPYHETNTFVRVLQTVRIRDIDTDWNWLRRLQKPGLPLPKSVIINRAASHAGFLSFITRSTVSILREFGSHANLLQTQINFYTSVVVGALEVTTDFKEWHISTLLESLLFALNAKIIDVAAAGYVIAAQLVSRTQLKTKLCNALLERVVRVTFEELRPAAVMLLVLIFDKQESAPNYFSDKAFNIILGQKWLIPIIAVLVKQNIEIFPLYSPLLCNTVRAIQSRHEEEEIFKRFGLQLLTDVDLPKSSACTIMSCFLDFFVYEPPIKSTNKLQDGDIIELDSDEDEEMPDSQTAFTAWYSDYLRRLEQKYPDAFDLTIKQALSSNAEESQSRKIALKIAVGYRLKIANDNAMDIYESLYHHNARLRQLAMQTLIKNLNNYQTRFQNLELLKACLADRLLDDSRLVVGELLKLPPKDFIDILGCEQYANGLLNILHKIQTQGQGWSKLTHLVIKHLISPQLLDGYDINLVLLAIMPLLFPSDNNYLEIDDVMQKEEIQKSSLMKKFSFLRKLEMTSTLSPNERRRNFLRLFDNRNETLGMPKPKELFESLEKQGVQYFKQAAQISNFLILLTVSFRESQSASESLKMFEYITALTKNFQIKQIDNLQKAQWEDVISLRLFTDFLLSMISHTSFEQLQCWNGCFINENQELTCFLRFFELIGEYTCNATKPEDLEIWSTTLKQFFDTVFPDTQMKVDFLTKFYINTDILGIDNCTAVERLMAFKVLNSVLGRKKDYKINLLHILRIGNALVSQHESLRKIALETLSIINNELKGNLKYLVQGILDTSYEISMDKEQYPLMLYVLLSYPKKRLDESKANKILTEVLELFNKSLELSDDISFISQLLDIFKYFNDKRTIIALIPLAMKAIESATPEGNAEPSILPTPFNSILFSIIQRFQVQTLEYVLQEQTTAWTLFEKIFEQHNVYMCIDGNKLQTLPCALLNTFNTKLFDSLSAKHRFQLIQLILRAEALSQNDTIALAAHKLLKHSNIDCKPLVAILQQMYTSANEATSLNKSQNKKQQKRLSNPTAKSNIQTNTLAWKEGVALLELLEHKEKLSNAEQLIPALFELLKQCLEMDEQANIEYTKQLILSTLLHCCRLAELNEINLEKSFPKTIFRIDRIVQCVRATQNPQTHQNALTLLAHCAAHFPQQVLHNVVDIFTFMGSSVARHDDAFSFHIIDNIIVSIIPILVQADQKSGVHNSVISVLKVFSDIMLDVPEHRRISLYTKLMDTLGAETHFWRFLCIVFETQVVDEEKRRLLQRKTTMPVSTATSATDSTDKQAKRFEMVMSLSNAFEPKIILETCTQLLFYLKNALPLSKEFDNISDVEPSTTPTPMKSKRKSLPKTNQINETELFDISVHIEKQLRHFKYTIMQYLSSVSKAPELLRKIALLTDNELLEMKPFFQNFIIGILAYVPTANSALERFEEPLQVKFWKVILHHLHDVLDNAISLLSADMFLVVIIGLMQHQMLSIRKKVIELLITKMQSQDDEDLSFLVSCDEQRFRDLIMPLKDIVNGILTKPYEDESQPASPSSNSSNELIFLQQTALIAIKLLSRHFAIKYIVEFKDILANLTKSIKCRSNISKIVLATIVLALIEISSNLKAHSLEQLPKFMPQLIDLLQQQAESVQQHTPDHVCVAILTGFQKLFESLPKFLGPYIVDIISALSSISTHIAKQEGKKDQRSIAALAKISTIWTRIASDVHVRILVPSCETSYKNMLATNCYDEIEDLMKLLREAIAHASNDDLAPVQNEVRNFFLNALAFRLEMKQKPFKELKRISIIESTIVDAFVAYVLKLSESAFRPLYENVYDWAIKRIAQPETQLTYFILSSRIGDSLKSLFTLFAGTFWEDATYLLEACNTSKITIDTDSEMIHIELLKAILSTLHIVFLYASKNFINIYRFEMIMSKIVDQLENRFVLEDEDLQNLLSKCIAQLAVVVSSDVMWKQLNYQVLLKTRTNIPEVRILSFNCCVDIARKLGDEFTSLLPETVPFIAELFEDENARVEKNTRKSVQELEIVLGESLQKYL